MAHRRVSRAIGRGERGADGARSVPTEFRAAVASSSLGKRMAIPMNSTANRVKRMLSSIGSPEVVTTTDSDGVTDEAEVPPSPASPDSPSLKAAL